LKRRKGSHPDRRRGKKKEEDRREKAKLKGK